jgi:hypothetical protein
MTTKPPEVIDLDAEQLDALLRRAEEGIFDKDDYELIGAVLESYFYVTQLIDKKSTTIGRLRKLLFGSPTEKTSAVLGRPTEARSADGSQAPPAETRDEASSSPSEAAPTKKGHGRNGADDFPNSPRVRVAHSSLKAGDPCPQCPRGTVYEVSRPGMLVRFLGQSPVQATIYELQKLRCHLCGQVFTASAPAEVSDEKYDATVASMIGLLKYGCGLPFNRFDGLQEHLQVPLPASTQWEIVSGAVPDLTPAHQELIRQAAQGEVVHNDDTAVKILQYMGDRARLDAMAEAADEDGQPDDKSRTGLFTSGVVATRGGERIALFFSGRKHAGENLMTVLQRRAADLPPPIQMCDALSRNLPGELQTIVANCLAHSRRQFVDVSDRFRAECQYVLEAFEVVYRNDAVARQRELSPAERLAFHQSESSPTMERLRDWLRRQFDERLVEPNSALGTAINYLRKHWDKLTLFLRVPGAPLDNNVCERALKKAILHRKNALFYKTQNGANVGDLYMSLIHTCELCGANPFEYLTELQRHADQVAAAPAQWLPWNYRANLAAA